MYEPAEDSFLMCELVNKYKTQGKVLDMCTGTGIVAQQATKYSKTVIGADIDKKSLEYAKKHVKTAKFVQSNYFSSIKGTYDWILCNPPYLPNDSRIKDKALDGGAQGWEFIEVFLSRAKQYLKQNGKILLVYANLTKPVVIDELYKKYGYTKIEETIKPIGIEVLHACLLEDSGWNYLAEGKRNYVLKRKNIVKKLSKSGKQDNLKREYEILTETNKAGIGAKVIKWEESLYMRYVKGKDYEEWATNGKLNHYPKIVESLLEQARKLDELQIDKSEFTRPYSNIKIKDGKVTLLDFERARKTDKPKNVLQLASFFANKLKIDLKKESKTYAKSYSQKNYENIKKKILKKANFREEYYKVWELLRKVPKGNTTTYKALGDKAGIKSYRFIGKIMNQNPFAPIIPCHRVVAKNGIGGYAHGVEEKKKLLRKEGIKLH